MIDTHSSNSTNTYALAISSPDKGGSRSGKISDHKNFVIWYCIDQNLRSVLPTTLDILLKNKKKKNIMIDTPCDTLVQPEGAN